MDFRTQYDRVEIVSNSGDYLNPTYSPKVYDDGSIDLVETGVVDTYQEIQAWKDSCDIHAILRKYFNGDASALSKNTPLFGDFTEAPQSLAEYYQRMIDAEAAFNRLPVETRAQFNHSASEFFSSIGSEKFNKIMGIKADASANGSSVVGSGDVTSEVKDIAKVSETPTA